MKKLLVLAIAAVTLLAYGCNGCGSQSCGSNAADEAAKADSLAAAEAAAAASAMQIPYGTYMGTFPCADCPGIDVVLVLSPDGSTLSTLYKERDTQPTVVAGTAGFDAHGNLVFTPSDSNEEVSLYAVEGNALRRLGADGSPVVGELAQSYVLVRQ